jgi:hypothetical protein
MKSKWHAHYMVLHAAEAYKQAEEAIASALALAMQADIEARASGEPSEWHKRVYQLEQAAKHVRWKQ